MGMELAEDRRAYAEFAFREGLLSNRDVVEAENDLLNARNAYAAAQADLRVAILNFRRDTGTLRTDDEGNFLDR
jgi:outer membrane protein TolC